MILTALGIMIIILVITTIVIIIWKVYHMRGALGQVGEIFTILKNKANLSGLLEAGRSAQEKLQSSSTAETSGNKASKEATIKPVVALPLYQAIGEEFTSEKQMKKYLSKIKKMQNKNTEESEGVTSDTT